MFRHFSREPLGSLEKFYFYQIEGVVFVYDSGQTLLPTLYTVPRAREMLFPLFRLREASRSGFAMEMRPLVNQGECLLNGNRHRGGDEYDKP